jgi:glycosyltransferase involved in cell wall biosynthesis
MLLYLTSEKSPIYWCTSPNKIFEYMATNNPILAPNIGSIPEILNESNSYIFNIDDDSDLIDKIRIIMNNDNNIITKKAFSDILNNYSMAKRVKKIMSLLT